MGHRLAGICTVSGWPWDLLEQNRAGSNETAKALLFPGD
jgi:hypothetical protein